MCPAPQRVSFHIRYPFPLLQRLTSSSVPVSQTPREVWKGLFVPEVQFSAVGGNCIKVRQLWKEDPEPLDLSCWKLRRSHVSAQTLHGHRILVCSYTHITLALKGDVFTSVFTPWSFIESDCIPSQHSFFLAKEIMSKSLHKKNSGLLRNYPPVTF